MSRLLALKDLVHDLIETTTDLVEETHESVARKPVRLLEAAPPLTDAVRAVDGVRRLTTAIVYTSIRATNRGIQALEDAGIALARSALAEAATSAEPPPTGITVPLSPPALDLVRRAADLAQGALNGVMGDFLRDRENGLQIRMSLHHAGRELRPERGALSSELPTTTPKVVVFVHGLGCTEWAWNFMAADFHGDPRVNFGTLLARDLGYTPLYVRYNTGLHISENGRALSELLSALVREYPVPIEQIVLVGHSMGGLVSRSAAHYGAQSEQAWVGRLTHVFCVGSPHLGAPLEKAGNVLASVLGYFDTAGTQVPAKILNARSAGIKDLRFGYVVDDEWLGRDPDAFLEDNRRDLALVDSVTYCFLAGTFTRDPKHPLTELLGDVLVRLPSAAGHHPEPARRIPFHIGRVVAGAHHLALVNHPEVYAEIGRWLSEPGTIRRKLLDMA